MQTQRRRTTKLIGWVKYDSNTDKVETSLERQEHFCQFQDTTDAIPCHIHLPVTVARLTSLFCNGCIALSVVWLFFSVTVALFSLPVVRLISATVVLLSLIVA